MFVIQGIRVVNDGITYLIKGYHLQECYRNGLDHIVTADIVTFIMSLYISQLFILIHNHISKKLFLACGFLLF